MALDSAERLSYPLVSNERSTQNRDTVPRAARLHQRDAADKLQHILHHAALVFSAKGYEGASVRDISRSSGVSLSGLYYYVESKQKLLYLIQLNAFKTILARLEKRLVGVGAPEERLRILVHNHIDYFLRHPLEMKVLSHEDEALEGPFRKEVAEIKRRYFGIAVAVFEELRKSGQARRLNPRVAVLSLFGMMNWIHTWHRRQRDPQADALADAMAGMFLHGVLNGRPAAYAKAARMGRGSLGVAVQATG